MIKHLLSFCCNCLVNINNNIHFQSNMLQTWTTLTLSIQVAIFQVTREEFCAEPDFLLFLVLYWEQGPEFARGMTCSRLYKLFHPERVSQPARLPWPCWAAAPTAKLLVAPELLKTSPAPPQSCLQAVHLRSSAAPWGLVSKQCVCTKQGWKRANATSPAKVGI